jgi:hypothetical protein
MIRAVVVIMALASAPSRADWQCDGIITSSGTCIGSERNTSPPIIRCDPDSDDPRCWRRERR